MKEKEVWTLVKRPKNVNVIWGLWLFRKKYNIDGLISKYKARLLRWVTLKKKALTTEILSARL